MNRTTSKQILATLVCTFGLFGSAISSPESGQRAPDFALRSLDGTNLRLSEYRSEVVVLNFWAVWCGKCRAAAKSLNTLQTLYANDGLQVLSVGVDGDPDKAREYAAELGLQFPIMPDNPTRTVSKSYDLAQLPVTVIIDREGAIRYTHKGFKAESEQLIAAEVAELLNE